MSESFDNKDYEEKKAYKCIHVSDTGDIVISGRYLGYQPKEAAFKAFYRLNNESDEIYFCMAECTRGSDKKIYVFRGSKVQYDVDGLSEKSEFIKMHDLHHCEYEVNELSSQEIESILKIQGDPLAFERNVDFWKECGLWKDHLNE